MQDHEFSFYIHDLNTWGGQDQSTLEIIRKISLRNQVQIYSFTLSEDLSRGKTIHHQIRPNIRRPVLLKIFYYYLATFFGSFFKPKPIVSVSTGTAALLSDCIQVQFVQCEWRDRLRKISQKASLPPKAFMKHLYESFMLEMNCWIEKRIYTKNRKYIAISHSVKKELEKHFGLKDQVCVIHHGVDSERFIPPRTPETQAERMRIRSKHKINAAAAVGLFVGTYDRKGLKTTLQAIALLSKEARRQFHLLAVGGGDLATYRAITEQLGIQDCVTLVTHEKEVRPYYWSADFFVMPTRYEPFGLVVIEAMACGLPPLVSRCAGASELIQNDESGLLIENELDPKEIASKMELLILDQKKREALSSAARTVAVEHDWETVAQQYEAFLSHPAARLSS